MYLSEHRLGILHVWEGENRSQPLEARIPEWEAVGVTPDDVSGFSLRVQIEADRIRATFRQDFEIRSVPATQIENSVTPRDRDEPQRILAVAPAKE